MCGGGLHPHLIWACAKLLRCRRTQSVHEASPSRHLGPGCTCVRPALSPWVQQPWACQGECASKSGCGVRWVWSHGGYGMGAPPQHTFTFTFTVDTAAANGGAHTAGQRLASKLPTGRPRQQTAGSRQQLVFCARNGGRQGRQGTAGGRAAGQAANGQGAPPPQAATCRKHGPAWPAPPALLKREGTQPRRRRAPRAPRAGERRRSPTRRAARFCRNRASPPTVAYTRLRPPPPTPTPSPRRRLSLSLLLLLFLLLLLLLRLLLLPCRRACSFLHTLPPCCAGRPRAADDSC